MVDIDNFLIRCVDGTLADIGMPVLKHPVFYSCPVGLRFEISDPMEDSDEPSYFESAYRRAAEIYIGLPAAPDILRIDIGLDPEESREGQLAGKRDDLRVICGAAGLPVPEEERETSFSADAGWGEAGIQRRAECYWDLKKISPDLRSLLMQILLTDFPSAGGHPQFESAVFLFDTAGKLLFHLYDDRGLDLVAEDRDTLYPFYDGYGAWIMDCDRERIEGIFGRNRNRNGQKMAADAENARFPLQYPKHLL